MKSIERVGVKNLKSNLSAYLRQVQRGVRVLITDRDEVITEIGRPRRHEIGELLFEEWIRRGELRPRRRSSFS
jgi:antitoxin (DNA-binding transcriptional repressor) of toxin-antitoxin stability system